MANHLKHSIVVGLMLTTCIIALTTYKQYGIAWDEFQQRLIGIVNFAYAVNGDQGLLHFRDRDYGPAFELPMIVLEIVLNLKTARDIFLMRHLVAHFFFLVGAASCFLLVDFLYKNKLLATIAFLLIVLNPRLYAHSFFNTKDIPFLSMFFICFYLNAIAFNKNKIRNFVYLGIGAGILINIRIMGVLFACCVIFLLAIDAFLEKIEQKPILPTIHLALAFLGATCITLYITWPFLWTNPVGRFILAFKNMSKFRFETIVLFKGVFVKSTELPWDYIPTWFLITTPVAYMIAALVGIVLLFIHFSKDPRRFLSNTLVRNNLLFAICFFTPVASVIILKSVLYDGWRQMYFIYSAFVLLILYGLNALFKTRLKTGVIAVLLLEFCFIGYFMVVNFPFQHVYFNNIVDRNSPENLRRQFDLDYWGTSYKQSLEYILSNDASPLIHVAVHNNPGKFNVSFLPTEQGKRIKLTDNIDKAEYYITNYRGQAHDYYSTFESKKVYSIKVGSNTINSVFKLK